VTQPPRKVLMVCMGNICRSPTAEGVLRRKLREAGLHELVVVDSAGTHSYHVGEPPDHRAVEHAKRRGYDLSALRARQVSDADFERFDLILAMDRENLGELRAVAPGARARAKVRLLREFDPASAGGEDLDVPDPYYGGARGFETVLDLVAAACGGLLDDLRARASA
jgi:protein-tyrosine phosphatase